MTAGQSFPAAGDASAESLSRCLSPTSVLDIDAPRIRREAESLRSSNPGDRAFVRAAHRRLADERMCTIYSLDEAQPASVTMRENKGTCGQRMVVLEALARAAGIATRERALWLSRTFWYYRLALIRWLLPEATLYYWPQFYLDGRWVDFDEIHEPIGVLAARARRPFVNDGISVFSAVETMPVDFLGKTRGGANPECDISAVVLSDGGFFDSRDDLLRALEKPPSAIGQFVYNLLYRGREIRRRKRKVAS
jgi:hypothetical protein